MSKITFILGAGFSRKAGLRLAKEINEFFLRNNETNLLFFPSGEWKWKDFADDSYLTNGRLNPKWLPFGFILNSLVAKYQELTGSFISYEDFYQFCLDRSYNKDFYINIYKTAHEYFDKSCILERTHPSYSDYTYDFEHTDTSDIMSLLNHLIDDLLYWRKDFNEILTSYSTFLDYINLLSEFSIITLNHDYLIEALFEANLNKGVSDGFSIQGTSLFSTGGKPIKIFNGSFELPVNFIKLHGSLDLYKFILADDYGGKLIPTGEYIYYKTLNFIEKHRPIRKDTKTGIVLQNFNINFTPQFITGTRKEELVQSDYMYKFLYNHSKVKLSETELLYIIGYSFQDIHVNKMIEETLVSTNLKRIVNINPNTSFPYICKGIDTRWFKDIAEPNAFE